MNSATKPLKTIFSDAIEIADPTARARYLGEACGADAELRRHAEELIAAHTKAMSFLDPAKTEQPPTVIASTPLTEREGSLIGRYKLLEKLGEGGFGAVYVAEQREPVKRRVALKIIKLGMDTKHVVARFEAERQALAMMDHPHIARVLDAGSTDTGRPYFVMELVRGMSITKYCDDNNLPTRERLELFLKVCNAIQHAHQKGIIHRDIKPSNVMVTLHDGVPVPKVIDFGIAKATQGELTEKTVYTQFQQFIGTPAYMSPEQAEMSGLDVDTRSDIYSLGVLLYELLIGKTPFDGKELMMSGLDEMRRTLREKEPLKPSTRLRGMADDESSTTAKRRGADLPKLMHLLRGDLDWIVMMCLEKDRTRRYDTANGLAMDIQRHLTNEPVAARPPSQLYRLQKMARRNKIAFTAAAAVALVLIVGLTVATLGWRAARAERDKAVTARGEAETARTGEAAQLQRAEKALEKEAEQRRKAEDSELAARKNLYAADMLLAQQALAENDRGRALRMLDQHRPKENQPDLRGWEWRHLWRLCQSDELATVGTHSNGVWVVRASPDGKLLASVDLDNTLKVWNGQLRWEITNLISSVPITAIAFSTDGSLLAIADGDGGVKLCDPITLREFASLQHSNSVATLTFSADGKTLVTISQNQFRQWDLKSRREIKVRDLPHGDVWFFKFGRKDCISLDGSTVAIRVMTEEGDGILLWDLERGFARTTIQRSWASLQNS